MRVAECGIGAKEVFGNDPRTRESEFKNKKPLSYARTVKGTVKIRGSLFFRQDEINLDRIWGIVVTATSKSRRDLGGAVWDRFAGRRSKRGKGGVE